MKLALRIYDQSGQCNQTIALNSSGNVCNEPLSAALVLQRHCHIFHTIENWLKVNFSESIVKQESTIFHVS